jgi:hypothetical protein
MEDRSTFYRKLRNQFTALHSSLTNVATSFYLLLTWRIKSFSIFPFRIISDTATVGRTAWTGEQPVKRLHSQEKQEENKSRHPFLEPDSN